MKILIDAQIVIDTKPEEEEPEPKIKAVRLESWENMPDDLKKVLKRLLPKEFIDALKE